MCIIRTIVVEGETSLHLLGNRLFSFYYEL